ncbi:phosphate ABC transporter substrate-binding protein [Lutispora sp.]|uniref:phosphate ABC transporter substrate-binding protein n=1 Tax=Lutispora sp. TaxID=2828727 RepID=UPI002B220CC9|nr:phosphate ABC transporter substrate-binding protein PstS family protein [Lutispora sp.]MEA4962009.1 phosphate ABC transporter substrate-binding protein PstS family protein [Lutispora sp.]
MKKSNIKGILSLVLTAGLILAGCSGQPAQNEPTPEQPKEPEKQSIVINGSTSVQPLAEELSNAFKSKNPNATIDIQGGGSGVGIKSAGDGVVDIGMSSRDLKPEEKSLKEFKIAIDGIAVIVHPENGVKDLTVDQLRKIYTGEITNWKEVGGKDAKITVVTREEGSGTRGAFIELVKLEVTEGDKKVDKTLASAITQGSTGAVMTTVAGDANAIGFASFGSAKDKTDIKLISIDGSECNEENISAGSYKISRPFLMLTKDEPAGLAKAFLDFILSAEGQGIVAENNYLKAVK